MAVPLMAGALVFTGTATVVAVVPSATAPVDCHPYPVPPALLATTSISTRVETSAEVSV